MMLTGQNRSTGKQTCLLPNCPTQISHEMTRHGTQASVVLRPVTNRLSNGTIKNFSTVTGLEPAIFGSEVRRLIH